MTSARSSDRTTGMSEETTAKVTLTFRLNELLNQQGLSHTAAVYLLGMVQPRLSAILNCKLRGVFLEHLMQLLPALNQQVGIVVKPGHIAGSSSIRVAV